MRMYLETDPRVLSVLDRAVHSESRATRLRAVAMLARVSCEARDRWLAERCEDPDTAVAQTVAIVCAWVIDGVAEWPEREDPAFDRLAPLDARTSDEMLEAEARFRWLWEYALEVWREDGLLVGTYLATTCEDDDEHAKRIALGHAILASTGPKGESFDPASAAAFIVGKRRVRTDAETKRR